MRAASKVGSISPPSRALLLNVAPTFLLCLYTQDSWSASLQLPLSLRAHRRLRCPTLVRCFLCALCANLAPEIVSVHASGNVQLFARARVCVCGATDLCTRAEPSTGPGNAKERRTGVTSSGRPTTSSFAAKK